eukprot:gene4170-20357_t
MESIYPNRQNYPKSEEKKLLRKRWIHLVGRKDFKPTSGHRVCSKHFPGGKKTYMCNTPTLTPKTAKDKPINPRSTTKARNRVPFEPNARNIFSEQVEMETNDENVSFLLEDTEINAEKDFQDRIKFLEDENQRLRTENERLRLENAGMAERLL